MGIKDVPEAGRGSSTYTVGLVQFQPGTLLGTIKNNIPDRRNDT